jgi:hypothetical protein
MQRSQIKGSNWAKTLMEAIKTLNPEKKPENQY